MGKLFLKGRLLNENGGKHSFEFKYRLDKNLGSRLRVTMHILKDPAKVNWEKAYNIFENLRKHYNVNINGKKNFEERKRKGLHMDLN